MSIMIFIDNGGILIMENYLINIENIGDVRPHPKTFLVHMCCGVMHAYGKIVQSGKISTGMLMLLKKNPIFMFL